VRPQSLQKVERSPSNHPEGENNYGDGKESRAQDSTHRPQDGTESGTHHPQGGTESGTQEACVRVVDRGYSASSELRPIVAQRALRRRAFFVRHRLMLSWDQGATGKLSRRASCGAGRTPRYWTIHDLRRTKGINATSFYLYRSGSPVVSQLVPGVFSLVGATPPPGLVEELAAKSRSSPRLVEHGWDGQGHFGARSTSVAPL